eukprot:scaffold187229_cov24-Tisochrysis_lutea.AAC.1
MGRQPWSAHLPWHFSRRHAAVCELSLALMARQRQWKRHIHAHSSWWHDFIYQSVCMALDKSVAWFPGLRTGMFQFMQGRHDCVDEQPKPANPSSKHASTVTDGPHLGAEHRHHAKPKPLTWYATITKLVKSMLGTAIGIPFLRQDAAPRALHRH